jgi:integrase
MVAKQPEGAKTMGWTQQRGNRYRGLYRDVDGKTKSAGTFQYAYQAQEAADAAEGRAGGGADRSELAELTVLEYAEHWLSQRTAISAATRRGYRGAIVNHIGPALGSVPLVELTKAQVRQWVVSMEDNPKVGAATRNASVKTLRMIYTTAVQDDDLLALDPTRGIKRQKPDLKAPRAFMSDEQISDLLQAAQSLHQPSVGRLSRATLPPDGMFELAVLLGVDAGLRWEEIAALDIPSIQTVGSRLTLHVHRSSDRKGRVLPTTKNHEARDIPVTTDRLRRALSLRMKQARLEHGPESLLIYRADGSPARYETWKRVLLAGAYAQAGISATGWHDLRHTYGSRLAEKGVATKIIATLMGHQEEDITQIYLHPSTTEHLANVVGGALSG